MDDHHATTNHVVVITHLDGWCNIKLFVFHFVFWAWIRVMVGELIFYSGPTMLLGATHGPLDHYFIFIFF